MFSSLLSRSRQFFQAFTRNQNDQDEEFIDTYLTFPAKQLFLRQSAYDQYHAMHQARLLFERTVSPDPILVEALFLHDVGKSLASITLAHRVAHVLFSKKPAWYDAFLHMYGHHHVIKPLYTLRHHATLGADLVRRIGLPERVAYLIEHHHDPMTQDKELQLLQQIDASL